MIYMVTMTYKFNSVASIINTQSPPHERTVSEEDFICMFESSSFIHIRAKKWAPLWTPALFSRPSREADAVTHITFFVADVDNWSREELDQYLKTIRSRKLKFICHSSFGWSTTKAKARLIFFLSEPIEIGTQWRWSEALWPRLMQYVNLSDRADPSCKDCSRAFYLPVKPAANADVYSEFHDGVPIDVPEVLGSILSAPLRQYDYSRPYQNREDDAKSVNLPRLHERVRLHYINSKAYYKIIDDVLCARPTEDGVGRHEIIRKFTVALAYVLEPEESTKGALQIMQPWLDSMQQKYGVRGESWKTEAERALVGAREKRPTWEAYAAAQLAAELGM